MKLLNDLIPLLIYLSMLLVLMVIGAVFAKYQCTARWEDSGMRSRWGPIPGCRVKRDDGKWIPSENLRDMDLQPREVRP